MRLRRSESGRRGRGEVVRDEEAPLRFDAPAHVHAPEQDFFSENALFMGSSAFSFSVPCQLEAIHLQEMCVGHRLGRHCKYNTRRISEIISPQQQVEVLKLDCARLKRTHDSLRAVSLIERP